MRTVAHIFFSFLLIIQLVAVGFVFPGATQAQNVPDQVIEVDFPSNPAPGAQATIVSPDDACLGSDPRCGSILRFNNVPNGSYQISLGITRDDRNDETQVCENPQKEDVDVVSRPSGAYLYRNFDLKFLVGECNEDDELFTPTSPVFQVTEGTVEVVGEPHFNPANGDFSVDVDAQLTLVTLAAPELTLDKQAEDNGGPFAPGDEVTYTINYSNTGTEDATNATLVDTLQATYVDSIVDSGGATTDTGGPNFTLTWDLGTVAAGTSGQVQYTVRLKSVTNNYPSGVYPIPNTVVLTTDTDSLSDNDEVEVAYTADPYISKTRSVYSEARELNVGASQARPGEYVVYRVTYGNNGTANALETHLRDVIDNASLYSVEYVSHGGQVAQANDQYTIDWTPAGDLGNCRPTGQGCGEPVLQPDQGCLDNADLGCDYTQGTRTVILKVNDVVPVGTTVIDEVASILYKIDPDGVEQEEQVNILTPVTAAANCVISKAVDKPTADPGENITYTITYENTSTEAACTGVSIVDTLDGQNQDKISVVANSITDGGVLATSTGGDEQITWTVGSVAPSSSSSVSYSATIDADYPVDVDPADAGTLLDIYNQAQLISDQLPGGVFSNEVVTRVSGGPVLTIIKAVDKIRAEPGDTIVYTFNVQNVGNVTAQSVVLRDPFTNLNQDLLTLVSTNPESSTNNGVIELGDLAPGESTTATLTAKISDNVPAQSGGTTIFDKGTVESETINPVTSNEVLTYLNPLVVIEANKEVNVTKPLKPNQEFTYTINYSNTGDALAVDVVVADPFINENQEYIEFVSADPAPNPGTDNIFSVGSLAAGKSGSVKIVARIVNEIPEGTTVIEDVATVKSSQTDEVTTNQVDVVAIYQPPVPQELIKQIGEPVPTTGRGTAIAIAVAAGIGLIGVIWYVMDRKKKMKAKPQ